MAFQRVPNTVEIRVIYTLYGENVMNTYHAQDSNGYDQTKLNALAAAIDSGPVVGMKSAQSLSLAYVRTDVVGLDTENDLSASANANAGPGLVGTRALPGNVTFTVQRLSGLTGRSARGRVFFLGIPFSTTPFEGSQTNILTQATADNYLALVDAFRTAIPFVAFFFPVIVSRFNNGSKRVEGVVFPWNTTAYKDRKVDTQRRRLS